MQDFTRIYNIHKSYLQKLEEEEMKAMTGDSLREMLAKADKGGYAVPAFNFTDIWDFLAICEAAQEENAPVMVASHTLVVNAIGVELTAAWGKAMMEKQQTPLILHLDHSSDIALCKAAIDNGYPSVMIDASACSLEDNIRITKEVTDYAKPFGTHVEAEIGKIKGRGYEGGHNGDDFLVQVADAKALVEATGVDSLAVGVGTAHGFYEGKPEINFQRLKEVNEAVSVPLVLHGGTGIPMEDIRKAIELGINKVNVGTLIHTTYMNSLRAELNRVGDNPFTIEVMNAVRPKIKEAARGWIRACNANGKA